MVQWLSSKRIEGTDAERIALPVNSLEVGWKFTTLDTFTEYVWDGIVWVALTGGVETGVGMWKELARVTLGSPTATVDLTSIFNKRFLMNLLDLRGVGTFSPNYILNGDTGNNYNFRQSQNFAGDATSGGAVNVARLRVDNTDSDRFHVGYFANLSTAEKLHTDQGVSVNVSGAGTAPNVIEIGNKWTNTATAINQMTISNSLNANNFDTGSEIVMLGYDPSDTATDNFWEPLADITLTSTTDVLQSGTITSKKYLWFQFLGIPTVGAFPTLTFNGDGAANYSMRRSTNGASIVGDINQNGILVNVVTNATKIMNVFVKNVALREKIGWFNYIDSNVEGDPTSIPSRRQAGIKYSDTSLPITSIEMNATDSGGTWEPGSFLRVWGAN